MFLVSSSLQINTIKFIEREKRNETKKVNSSGEIKNCDHTPDNNGKKRSKDFVEPHRPSSIRKPMKRIRSPGLEDVSPGKFYYFKMSFFSRSFIYFYLFIVSTRKRNDN